MIVKDQVFNAQQSFTCFLAKIETANTINKYDGIKKEEETNQEETTIKE